MNKQIEALKMAIEGMAKAEKVFDDLGLLLIKFGVNPSDINFHKESFLTPVIQACKEALAEAEKQEIGEAEIRQMLKEIEWCHKELEKKEWQSLSDDDMEKPLRKYWGMNKQIEALKMAMGFASVISETYATGGQAEKVIKACKEALAEAEKQEPVAEVIEDKLADWSKPHVAVKWNKVDFKIGTKFYTHPATWQSLSDDNILKLFKPKFECEIEDFELIDFARAIEQSLKELNAKK